MNQTVGMIIFMQTHIMNFKDDSAIISNILIKNDKEVIILTLYAQQTVQE